MRKNLIIIILLFIVIVSALLYLKYDSIVQYITNKEWQKASFIKEIYVENLRSTDSTNSHFIVATNDGIYWYNSSGTAEYTYNKDLKDVIIAASKNHVALCEKSDNKVRLFNNGKELWNVQINGEVKNITINDSGNIAVIYTTSGYKSVVKAIKANGTEWFTTYLASMYAVDTKISDDNKLLAVAEVGADGVLVSSSIRFINTETQKVKEVSLGSDILVTNIEYNSNEELVVQEDAKIEVISTTDYSKRNITKYRYSDVNQATIGEKINGVVVTKENQLKIFNVKEENSSYALNGMLNFVHIFGNYIIASEGKELLVINGNGKLIKTYIMNGNLKDVKVYSNNSVIALIYKDSIEFIKI